jgi:hypothetical protein
MQDGDMIEGMVLGVVRKPREGWGPVAALRLNQLIRRIAVDHDWRHLVVRMHPATWSQVMPYLDYNLAFPKPGIPMDMDGGVFEDTRRIEVVWREVVRHPY